MKHITSIIAAPGLIWLCALPSCGSDPESEGRDKKSKLETSGESFKDEEFSPWMSKADQQIAYEKRREGTYFAYTEGRSKGGLQQYRHVVKPLPADNKTHWAVYWGLTANEFYQVDLKLQRDGYIRKNLQVFQDGSGVAYHQGLWMKKD